MDAYTVRQFHPKDAVFEVDVPASKSLLNRALILAAFGKGEVFLACGSFAEDTRSLLGCLAALGIRVQEESGGLRVIGCGGNIPNRRAELYVGSAGTAARFLTAALAFLGGEYHMRASAQMEQRPMELLAVLEEAGISVEYEKRSRHFPFILRSDGLQKDFLTVNTDLSTQYASGILLAAAVSRPVTLCLTGSRTHGSYIAMTLAMLHAFGARWTREENTLSIAPAQHSPARMEIEGDLSGACYFYALALLFSTKVRVRHIHADTLQGDRKFLTLLADRGVKFTDSESGLCADGSKIRTYKGFCENMKDYSDQALTAAALAPFADSPTRITGIGHIRHQECDRIRAIAANLSALGVPVAEEEDGVSISPAPVRSGTIRSFGDHRVAMAFALIGLKTGGVTILDPLCCRKTFDNFFTILDDITQ